MFDFECRKFVGPRRHKTAHYFLSVKEVDIFASFRQTDAECTWRANMPAQASYQRPAAVGSAFPRDFRVSWHLAQLAERNIVKAIPPILLISLVVLTRSEERRVGKEC